MSLLEIRNLSVDFSTSGGQFRAVDGVDLTVDKGDILAIVGESGSGKSVSMLAMMGLLPWTATITADVLEFDGIDLRTVTARNRRGLIGKDIAMIFQEPMSSLNPCFTVGFQIKEALRQHLDLSSRERQLRAVELLEQVGIPDPERRLKVFPHQLDRDGHRLQATPADRGRADNRAGCDHSGADLGSADRASGRR